MIGVLKQNSLEPSVLLYHSSNSSAASSALAASTAASTTASTAALTAAYVQATSLSAADVLVKRRRFVTRHIVRAEFIVALGRLRKWKMVKRSVWVPNATREEDKRNARSNLCE